jgi:hypothetical protein
VDAGQELCRCGHVVEVHVHYRIGEDCGTCGRKVCPFWSPPRWWHRFYDPWSTLRRRALDQQAPPEVADER